MPESPTTAAVALDSSVVRARWPGRARLRVVRPDRLAFLHNLTTNEVKSRPPGSGCEAFVTNLQGRTLGFVSLLILEEAVLLRTEAESLPVIVPHLEKFGVLEDVELINETGETFEHHLAGPNAAECLGGLGLERLPEADFEHLMIEVAGKAVRVVREAPLGRPGFSLIGPSSDEEAIAEALAAAGKSLGLVDLSDSAFEALRIEAGTPASGRDVTEKNLPQELARDSQAISFTKGCYLGQETVARLDALGHVNRLIRNLRIDADTPPPPGSKLVSGEKEVGWICSAAVSERSGKVIALGYVRTSLAEPGSAMVVRSEEGGEAPAVVVEPVRE